MSSRWKKRNAKSRKDQKYLGEIPYQIEEGALAWDRQLCLGQWQWTGRDLWQPQKIQRGRRGSKRTNETLQGTWHRKVASGSASQDLGLGDRKVGSQVMGED